MCWQVVLVADCAMTGWLVAGCVVADYMVGGFAVTGCLIVGCAVADRG